MISVEALDRVYLGARNRDVPSAKSRYHAPYEGRIYKTEPETACGMYRLEDCDWLPESEAVLTRDPCSKCFLRGRRQRVLNGLVTIAEGDQP